MGARLVTLPLPRGPVAWAPKSWSAEFDLGSPRAEPFEVCGSYAVVDVCGPLFLGSHWCCETYAGIKSRVAAASASSSPEVLLRMSTPGGDFQGCLDTGRELRAIVQGAGKRLCAFTESQCSSAGYALASAADEIVITESGLVGSIGVWVPVFDETAAAKMNGIACDIFASGAAKTDRNPLVPMTDDARARTQAQVDDMAGLFFALVAELRGMSAASAKALEGAEFMGVRAVAVGLADRIATFDQLVTGASRASGARAMAAGAKASSKYLEEARVALRRASETEDDEGEMAKKALKALEKEEPKEDPKPDDKAKGAGEPPPKDEDKEKAAAAAKAAADEEQKKKDEEQAKAAGPAVLALHQELHALKAKDAERDARDAAAAKATAERAERAALFAKRPDFSAEARALFDKLPIADLKAAVEGPKAWPRANARPGSSVAASTPTVPGGERMPAYSPRLSAFEQELLTKTSATGPATPTKAEVVGTQMIVDYYDKATAKARAEELAKQLKEIA